MSHDHPVKQGRKCCAVINRFKLMSDIFIPSSYQSEGFQDSSSTYNMSVVASFPACSKVWLLTQLAS